MQTIEGFEDITEGASNHCEKLNGNGYPFVMIAKDIDFNLWLITCLDIYEALTEESRYRKGLTYENDGNIK